MYQIALIVRNVEASISGFQLLLVPVVRPSPQLFPGLPFQDSMLLDLPFAPISQSASSAEGIVAQEAGPGDDMDHSVTQAIVQDVQSTLDKIGLTGLDVADAVQRVAIHVPTTLGPMQPWEYWKLMIEPDYGPEPPRQTIIFMTEVKQDEIAVRDTALWLNPQDAWELLVGSDVRNKRLGPLATYVLSPHFPEGLLYKFNLDVEGQEYPPGVLVVPMSSSTAKPFKKTNLVIFASIDSMESGTEGAFFTTTGDALIMDPGCHPPKTHAELSKIVGLLPRKLLIFVTHHHLDHIEGLPTIQQQNPQAVIVAHEATIRRMGRDAKTFKCIPVVDGSKLLVGGQELQVVAAPGHTDGHMALLHKSTHTLIVGDHCVGQGSSRLDSDSGGNMQDYLATTRRFLELAPRVVVPMHGRVNVWPAHMLCGYIRHRAIREDKILKAIETGARTAYEIVSKAYSDTPSTLWMAALSNVKLHVEHLAQLQKLPLDFSVEAFEYSCASSVF